MKQFLSFFFSSVPVPVGFAGGATTPSLAPPAGG